MHVGLNLVYLVPGETGGTETYARELLPELVRAAPKARFTAFLNREAWEERDRWEGAATVLVPVNARRRTELVRGEQQLLPGIAGRQGVQLLHSLANTGPVRGRFARVVTIHDLIHRIVPEAHLGLMGLGMRVLVPLAARTSRRIIVPTRSTAGDVRQMLGIPEHRLDVVPEGLGAQTVEPEDEGRLREWLEAGDRPIALSVSAMRPHKNLPRLIRAMALIPPPCRPLLVLAGYPTPHERELKAAVAALTLQADVRIVGWIDQPRLEGLYRAAKVFVFPSLYEGFGLPILEAMARGLPVATSGRGALDEVAGDAALRFDPESEQAIAQAVERLITDGQEAARLRERGRRQARSFSWSAAAAGTLRSYERALALSS